MLGRVTGFMQELATVRVVRTTVPVPATLGDCVICLHPVELGHQGEMPGCKHNVFHAQCLVNALARSRACPVCRHREPGPEDLYWADDDEPVATRPRRVPWVDVLRAARVAARTKRGTATLVRKLATAQAEGKQLQKEMVATRKEYYAKRRLKEKEMDRSLATERKAMLQAARRWRCKNKTARGLRKKIRELHDAP